MGLRIASKSKGTLDRLPGKTDGAAGKTGEEEDGCAEADGVGETGEFRGGGGNGETALTRGGLWFGGEGWNLSATGEGKGPGNMEDGGVMQYPGGGTEGQGSPT